MITLHKLLFKLFIFIDFYAIYLKIILNAIKKLFKTLKQNHFLMILKIIVR